jgi:fructokinase
MSEPEKRASPGTGGGICIFGEVLFDHFPDGSRVLGGAPFNVAWHLQAIGFSPRFISRVGRDSEGEQVRDAMAQWGMECSGLQLDPERPTGLVRVSLEDGEPSYDIVEDCAYDAIEPVALKTCSLLYHGSLATRSSTSAGALARLRAIPPQRVFIDVNLRPPWWQRDSVTRLLQGAGWVKLNRDELLLLQGGDGSPRDQARAFLQEYGLEGLVVTMGSEGAELFLANGERALVAPEPAMEVVDTVGAGDAFAAVIIAGLVGGWSPELMLQRAQQFAGAVVGQRGATISDPAFYRAFIENWGIVDAPV